MKTPTRIAFTISLIFHLIALVTTFVVVVSQQRAEEFVERLDVDFFPALKTRERPPKARTKPVKVIPRQQVTKSPRLLSPNVESVQPAALQTRLTQTVTLNRPRHSLDSAQVSSIAKADISTTIRDLRADTTLLPETEADTPTGAGGRGLEKLAAPGVQRAHQHSFFDALAEEMGGDTVSPNLDLGGSKRPPLPEISFEQVMNNLARKIVDSSGGGPIDVVFVIDASGSMGDNIKSVREHLREMIDVYKAAKIDYALGLTEFWAPPGSPPHNIITVSQLTKNMNKYRQALDLIAPRKDENALDAIDETVREMRFRPTSKKHLILVTDEPFTSLKGLTLAQIIAQCREFGIYVNVLGLQNDQHQLLAEETDGSWHAIPTDVVPVTRQPQVPKARRSRHHARMLRGAQWAAIAEVSKTSLKNLDTNALDIVLFIDSSRSMADKVPEFLKQLEVMTRDWDNALVDYQIGVVRFIAGPGELNFVNVFQPHQTLKDIDKITSLPCRGDERLLDAVVEGLRRLKFRPGAQPYLILVTDETSTGQHSPEAVIQLCLEMGARVSVVGTYDPFQIDVTTETDGVWVPIPGGQTGNKGDW